MGSLFPSLEGKGAAVLISEGNFYLGLGKRVCGQLPPN